MLIALDSNVVIAALSPHEAHSQTAQTIASLIADGTYAAVVSSLTYGEVLTLRDESRSPKLDLALFFERLRHLISVSADDSICQLAGRFRHQYGIKLPDAIHLATACTQNAAVFVTNDRPLAKIAGLVLPTKTLAEWSDIKACA